MVWRRGIISDISGPFFFEVHHNYYEEYENFYLNRDMLCTTATPAPIDTFQHMPAQYRKQMKYPNS